MAEVDAWNNLQAAVVANLHNLVKFKPIELTDISKLDHRGACLAKLEQCKLTMSREVYERTKVDIQRDYEEQVALAKKNNAEQLANLATLVNQIVGTVRG
jgi:hypothetical protein